MSGADVALWQQFLTSQGLYRGTVDGNFEAETRQATVDFQRLHELQASGMVTNRTLGMALLLGFRLFEEPEQQAG
jgi:peptidoglycan hydrolase-like protein with peptidoglycan-binding domain